MNPTVTRRTRTDSPTRWMRAAERAVAEGVRVSQLQGTGQWVALSGTQDGVAYELAVTGNVAHGCDCLAGLNGDPVCKHKASFYLLIGSINLTPEPDPPAPSLTLTCASCNGGGVVWDREAERLGLLYWPCPVCRGTGTQPDPAALPVAPSVDADRIAA